MSTELELSKFSMNHISFKPDENKGPVVVLIEDVTLVSLI